MDLGLLALLPRLGLGSVVRRHKQPAVDWTDLHLTSHRGHASQISTATAGYRTLSAAELGVLLTRLSTQHAAALHDSHPLTAETVLAGDRAG